VTVAVDTVESRPADVRVTFVRKRLRDRGLERLHAVSRDAPRGVGRAARRLPPRGRGGGARLLSNPFVGSREGRDPPTSVFALARLSGEVGGRRPVRLPRHRAVREERLQNRNRIKTAGGAHWLTVPVRARLGTRIAEVTLDVDQPWGERHLRSIETAYGRAPHFPARREALARLYAQSWERLAPVAVASAEFLARAAGSRRRRGWRPRWRWTDDDRPGAWSPSCGPSRRHLSGWRPAAP